MRQFVLEGLHPVRKQKGSSVESVCMQPHTTHDIFEYVPRDHPHTNISHVSINPSYSDAVVYVLSKQWPSTH